jgi:AraC-like DNA-binding protein
MSPRDRGKEGKFRYHPSMRYTEHPPHPALRPYVACYWTFSSRGAHLVLPDGCSDLLFTLGPRASGRVIGIMTRPLVALGVAPQVALGVRFRPGAAFDLLGLAGRELRDSAALLPEVLGPAGRTLAEQVLGAPEPGAARAVLENALLARLARVGAPDPRLRAALAGLDATCGRASVRALAAHVGLSERQLERLFDERIGVGVKLFGRVRRLQEAITRASAHPAWADLAADLGYADQSHLIREFKALSGMSPAEFLKARRVSDLSKTPLGPLEILSPAVKEPRL